jgi:hypothetical protein
MLLGGIRGTWVLFYLTSFRFHAQVLFRPLALEYCVLRHHSASFLLSWLTALCGLYCATMLQVRGVCISGVPAVRGCACN